MAHLPRPDLTTQEQPLIELISTQDEPGEFALTQVQKDNIIVDVIHDGNWLPASFACDESGAPMDLSDFEADYIRERDWGAGAVAKRVAGQLGLGSYLNVNVARVLMDFGRFPGSTPKQADHLHRFAINYPFSQHLGFEQKLRVLETYYDGVSAAMESALDGRLIKIAIHTYDQYNQSGTERPATSILTRSIAYQTSSELPAGLFDPIYPHVLAEFTADRVLRDRISLTLEKKQVPVAHNYPYCLPEGSLEVRYQVWSFFRAVRARFEEVRPESVHDPIYHAVWDMLLDTNLRSSGSEALRSHLHLYRRAPEGREAEFGKAAHAYAEVAKFCNDADDGNFVEDYRFSSLRSSSIAIEVRKDVICALGPNGKPTAINQKNVNYVGDAIAEAVKVYFEHDRTAHDLKPEFEIGRHAPWYAADIDGNQ